MKKTNRIEGLDFSRAFAIFGMMLVNYKIVFTYGIDKYLLLSNFISIFEGRAAAVFLILAGIGISLMSKKGFRTDKNHIITKDRITLIKRAIFLFLMGMILYVIFEWNADILHYYGVYMVLICPFLYAKPKNIVISICSILIVSTLFQVTMNYMQGWNESFTIYLDFYTIKGFLRNLLFNGYHPLFPWFTFILVGLLIGRIDLNNSRIVKMITILSISIAVIIEVISHVIIRISQYSEKIIYIFDTKPMNPTTFYILAASGWAIGFIGICIMLSKELSYLKTFKAIVATGQMALTHYIIHSVVILGLFYVIDGINYRDEAFVILLSTTVFVLMVVFSYIWLKRFKRGPFELLMRKLT